MSKKTPMKETEADMAVTAAVLENAGARLLEIVEGLEGKAELGDLIKADFDRAKSEGYDKAALKRVLKMRGETDVDRDAQAMFGRVVDPYWQALKVDENEACPDLCNGGAGGGAAGYEGDGAARAGGGGQPSAPQAD